MIKTIQLMLSSINKYPLEVKDRCRISLPLGSQVMFIEKIQPPGEVPVVHVWAKIDPAVERTELREFEMFTDGQEYDSKGRRYIGSVLLNTGMTHWFEKAILT